MKSDIQFIYFDLGGVFFNWENYFQTAAKTFHIPRENIIRLFDTYEELLTKGLLSPQEFWELCRDTFSVMEGKEFHFLESWVYDYIPVKQMHAYAAELSKLFPLGCISNMYAGMFEELLRQGKIPDISFRQKILSCHEGLRKPDPKIYELAGKNTGVPASCILYIEDTEKYLAPAKQLGWQTILFDTQHPGHSIREIQALLE